MDDITLFPPHFKLARVVGRGANMVSGWWFLVHDDWLDEFGEYRWHCFFISTQFDLVELNLHSKSIFSVGSPPRACSGYK